MKRLALTVALMLAASTAPAQHRIVHSTSQSFDDVVFGLENAILDRGLVISATHHWPRCWTAPAPMSVRTW